MNRFISVGLSIAVAPAILLGIAQLAGSEDAITVSEMALYKAALPIAAVLVLTGALLAAAKGRHGRRLTASLKPVLLAAISSGLAQARTLGTWRVGCALLAFVLLPAVTRVLQINFNVIARDVAIVLLAPVLLVGNSLGLRGVFAAPIVLAILGWALARRFPKPMAVAGGCLLAFPTLQLLSWDSIACKGAECNDLGLAVLSLALALWVALPGLVMLVTGVFALRTRRAQHGAQQPGAADTR